MKVKKKDNKRYYINDLEVEYDEFLMELMSLDKNNNYVIERHLEALQSGTSILFQTVHKTLRIK